MCKIIVSVKGVVRLSGADSGRILLLRRSSEQHYCPGRWELPGGRVESWGIKKNFFRELREETGLPTVVVGWRGVWLRRSVFDRNTWLCVLICNAICFMESPIVKLSVEHADFGWFPVSGDGIKRQRLRLTPETEYALGMGSARHK